jgi:uncharacterized protein YndB with AHSA1/START domain
MQTIEVTIDIDRPPEVVFPYVASPEKQVKWIRGWTNSTQSPPPTVQIGDQFQISFGSGANTVAVNAEIVAYQPNQHLKIGATSAEYHATYGITLEPGSGGTRVVFVTESEQYSPLMKLMTSLMGWFMLPMSRRALQGDLKKLKKMVEKET